MIMSTILWLVAQAPTKRLVSVFVVVVGCVRPRRRLSNSVLMGFLMGGGGAAGGGVVVVLVVVVLVEGGGG